MSITIIRNTGWIGCAARVKIKVNGKKTAKVKHNQHLEVELTNDKAHLKVSQFGVKSNEIEVKDGDVVEVLTAKWSRIVVLFVILTSFMYLLPLFGLPYQIVKLLIKSILFVMFISCFIVDGFHLRILERE